MGRSNMRSFSKVDGVRIAALCDCYQPNLELAQKYLSENELPKADSYNDFRKLLDRKDIDVVIAASPDHWHPLHAVMAARAGKDVYVEKPVSVCVKEGRIMTQVARETGCVMGVGTQQRSGSHFQKAVEIVKSGQLGKITKVSTWNYEQKYPEGIGNPLDCAPPSDLDWEMWLGPAPQRPFNWNRFGVVDDGRWSSFRWFWDYAGGMMTDWGTHLLDIVQWAMGVKGPNAVTAIGGKYALLDNRDTPDTMMAIFEYPGFVCSYENRKCSATCPDGRGYGISFHGTEGTLYLDREGFSLSPEMAWIDDMDQAKMLPMVSGGSEQHETHVKAYVDCVRSRKRFISDIEEGHYASATPHLANLALRLGRTIKYDVNSETIKDDPEASSMLMREYRSPWVLA